MLDNLREGARGPFGKIIVLVLVMAFGLFGVSTVVPLVFSGGAPVTVNGEDISAAEIQQRTSMERQRILQQLGDQIDPSAITEEMVRPQAIEQLVQDRLLRQAAEEAGFALSDREVDRLLVSEPAFREGGAFSPDAFSRVAVQQGMNASQLRSTIARNAVTNQWVRGIERGAFVVPHDLERYGALVNQTRSAEFVRIAPGDYTEEVTASADEVEAYYEENQQDFQTPEQVAVNYVHLQREDVAESVEITDEEVQAAYDNEVSSSDANADRSISHILIRSDERGDEEARAMAEDVRGQAVSGDFDALAAEYSEDPGSADNGGDLGIYQPGIFSESFETAVTSLDEPGDVSSVVETEFGYHIIRLDELVSEDIESFEERAPELRERLRNEAIAEHLAAQRDPLADSAFSSMTLEPVAQDFDLPIETTGLFTRDSGEGIADNPEVREAAFAPDVLEEEVNSDVVVLPDDSLVVLNLAEHVAASVRPLAEVEADIRSVLTAQKARDRASERAESLYAALESGALTEQVDGTGSIESLDAITRFSSDQSSRLVEGVFGVAEPVDGPVRFRAQLESGAQIVGQVTRARDGELTESEREDARESVRQTLANMVVTGVLSEIRENADVSIE